MSSKVSHNTLKEACRKFLQMEELQISLKNYDPQKGKCFSGTIRFKSTSHLKFSLCILGDQQHYDEVKAVDMPHMDIEALKKLNKNKNISQEAGQEIWYLFGFRIPGQADTMNPGPRPEEGWQVPFLADAQWENGGKMDKVHDQITDEEGAVPGGGHWPREGNRW